MKSFLQDDRGATAMEYGLLMAIISIVMMSALLIMGPALANTFNDAGAGLMGKSP